MNIDSNSYGLGGDREGPRQEIDRLLAWLGICLLMSFAAVLVVAAVHSLLSDAGEVATNKKSP